MEPDEKNKAEDIKTCINIYKFYQIIVIYIFSLNDIKKREDTL
ncbi:hypothetical protein MNV_60051 [Candidatus Methanoperedens nitroreducens]|uniref:Uncharacterized protein n=1 Tax=Candidatus Methanoperedens nitratireducens TaxID=1392998 RepID=A0A284VSA9_9EURY|nr:hypothetical protein MNV_60051 [Candidatus Methanoperedens nitroreducens]